MRRCPIKASMRHNAKLLWSRMGDVYLAVVRRKIMFLPVEILLYT